jgi:hypothetical protein
MGNAFDEIEALSESGTFWSPRNPEKEHPAKLVLEGVRWDRVTSKFSSEERDVIVGRDRDGAVWKVATNNVDLRPLHTGDVTTWNDERRVFEVIDNIGPVRTGEFFAVEYRGDRQYTNRAGQLVTTGSYLITRKPQKRADAEPPESGAGDDGIPF